MRFYFAKFTICQNWILILAHIKVSSNYCQKCTYNSNFAFYQENLWKLTVWNTRHIVAEEQARFPSLSVQPQGSRLSLKARLLLCGYRTVVPNVKNPPKIRLKNCEIDGSYFPATIWQVLNMKCAEWPETEASWKCRNFLEKIREITVGKIFLAGFSHLEPLCSGGH